MRENLTLYTDSIGERDFWCSDDREKSKSKEAVRNPTGTEVSRFRLPAFIPWIPLDSNQELRTIYIGSVLTPITLHTGHHKVKSPVSPVREKYPPFPLLLFPQQLYCLIHLDPDLLVSGEH